ncbi:uncharacterized protein Gasu_46900 [Galdieria sulphuraria]|uniref:Uncharacterized protein n=1 Tax=Galdieria sulphuraria TaxID=130081 RepID=M2WUR6_GALSU|nr:uncharacterized protein Gasu_46900 [Galdieria sulphuraria]EME27700.1 hypothetical protein Gasu_46900 [Galdieria sulphuraria]|eukprot:XP_005704220.1 hypothetical protein Gasu_46900 [Galdieria sulphuraria]
MPFDDFVNLKEHVTLVLLKAFLKDLAKCPLESRDALLSRIRVDLLKVVSSPCFGYFSKLFDVLVQEADWQLLCCLINLLDWLPIGKKKLVSSVELYQNLKKLGEASFPWKVSCKVEKDLLLSKCCARRIHEKWKYLLNPMRGNFVRREKNKIMKNKVTQAISKHREDYGVDISIARSRPSLGSVERYSTPKKKKKARRVSFPPDEKLVSIRYIDAFGAKEPLCEANLSNGTAELFKVKLIDTDNGWSDSSEIAWFPPYPLYAEASWRQPYIHTVFCADRDTMFPETRDELHLKRLENFYLKDFQDGLCIEIPLVNVNH